MDRSLNPRRDGRRRGAASHIVAVGPTEVREVRAVARRPPFERWGREGSATFGRPLGMAGRVREFGRRPAA
eukprot:1055297-Alexandrium_andersonii.AAC.1